MGSWCSSRLHCACAVPTATMPGAGCRDPEVTREMAALLTVGGGPALTVGLLPIVVL